MGFSALFLKLVNMSISAGWLILAVIVLRAVFRRRAKWIICLLWGVAALRLICPVSIESALSLIPRAETIPQTVLTGESFEVETGIREIDSIVGEALESNFYTLAETSGEGNESKAENPTVSGKSGNTLVDIAGAVWAAGVLVFGIYAAVSYAFISRRVRVSLRVEDNIFICDDIDGSFILGIISPRIYMPSSFKNEQAEYVMAHERAHISRGDHLWKPLGYLLLAVYWFNPLVWLAYILLSRDIELACDERVIRELDFDDKKLYSEVLLSCSINRRLITVCPLAFGEIGIKERVKNVLNYKKSALWVSVLMVAACAMLAVFFLTNPVHGEDTDGASDGIPVSVELTPAVEMMLRAYYDLGADDSITVGMLEGITSLKITADTDKNDDRLRCFSLKMNGDDEDDAFNGYSLAVFTVNGSDERLEALPLTAKTGYYMNYMIHHLEEYCSTAEGEYKKMFCKKFMAFYCLSDDEFFEKYYYNDSYNMGNAAFMYYPQLEQSYDLMVLDPFTTSREYAELYDILETVGLIDNWKVESDSFDCSSFEYFPNLKEVEFIGFEPTGYEFPEDVSVIVSK